jgi:tRNA (guanine-N(7)-)-methyltransferase
VPLNLDICCGNGEHTVFLAEKYRNMFFVGIELQYKEVYRTARKIRNRALRNTKVARVDAGLLDYFFKPGSIGDIYLLFPDPWPKRKQKKHRLVNQRYFDLLFSLMAPGRSFMFKTDNDDYMMQVFDCYKNSMHYPGLELEMFTRDFHSLDMAKNYYITAFERIFLREKKLINAMIIKKRLDVLQQRQD